VGRDDVLNEIFRIKQKMVDAQKRLLAATLQQTNPTLYNAMFKHISTRMQPMRFADYHYLIDIYVDKRKRKCIKSSVQSGKTEYMVIDHLTKAEKGLAILYVLPDNDLRNRFVKNRIEKMFTFVPFYRDQMMKATGTSKTVGLKHYGLGTIVYAGSGSPNQFKEIPADAIYADELDQFNFTNYAMAFDRLSSSPHKLITESANPTVSDYGIDEVYQRSDKKFWHLKCPHCNQWQKIDFFTNIVYQDDDGGYMLYDAEWEEGCKRDIKVFCTKCMKPINRLDPDAQWVAEYPHKDISGYQISKLFSPHNTVQEIFEAFSLAQKNQSKLQIFYNSDLGECFEAEGSKLTHEILNRVKGDYIFPKSSEGPCVMGIDVGSSLHVWIDRVWEELEQLIWAGTVREFEDIDELIKRFNVKSFVIDAMPETRKSNELCDKWPMIGKSCRYVEGKTEENMKEKKRAHEIQIDRLQIMDDVMDAFLSKANMLPKNADTILKGALYSQLCRPVRLFIADKDGGGDGRFAYTKGEDHYYHARVYARLARLQLRNFKFRSIKLGGGNGGDANRSATGGNRFAVPANLPPHLKKLWESQLAKMKDGGRPQS